MNGTLRTHLNAVCTMTVAISLLLNCVAHAMEAMPISFGRSTPLTPRRCTQLLGSLQDCILNTDTKLYILLRSHA